MKSNNFFLNNISLFFLFIYLLLGLYVVKDFGISVDEEFQRYSGFYWLNYIVDFTSFENFKLNVSENSIRLRASLYLIQKIINFMESLLTYL